MALESQRNASASPPPPLPLQCHLWSEIIMEVSKKASHKLGKTAGSRGGEGPQALQALRPVFPLSKWSLGACPLQTVAHSLHPTLGTLGNTQVALISAPLLSQRQATGVVSYVAATVSPFLFSED